MKTKLFTLLSALICVGQAVAQAVSRLRLPKPERWRKW